MRANAMAESVSRFRFLQRRDAAEAELNPERNPFAEAGDALVTTGLRAGLPLAAAVLSVETGPGMVPITAGAGAIGNRLANIYEDARGYEKPQKSFLGNLKEDLDWGAMAGLGAAVPALPRLPARFIARSPLKAAVTQGLADTAAGAITNTGMDAALQLSQTGELDSQRLAEMGLMGGGFSALIGLSPAMDTLRRGHEMRSAALRRAAGRARPVNQMPEYVPPVEPTLALGRGPQLLLQDGVGNIVPDGPPQVPQLPPPKSTSKTIKAVTERMATASDPEQKLAILKQEVKLRGDTLTMIEQRVALDAKISLESQIAKKNAAQEKVDTAVEAQEAQVAAVEKQQKQQEDLLKAQQKVEMEQVKAAEAANKQQQDAVAEQQRVADEAEKATKLLEPKPIVLANAAATAAKAIENQPGTGQGVLNEISSAPAQQAPDPQQMMPPSNAAPLPQQLQQPSSGIALPTISRPTKAQLKAIPEDTQFLYKEGENSYYQVDRTPEDPRGRTVDKQTLKAEGYDVSKLPKPPKNGVDDNFDERSLISGMADKEIENRDPWDHYIDMSRRMFNDRYRPTVGDDYVKLRGRFDNAYVAVEDPSGNTWTRAQDGTFRSTTDVAVKGRVIAKSKAPKRIVDWFEARDQASIALDKNAQDGAKVALAEPTPVPSSPASPSTPGKRKSANVGRIVKMMGDKLYSANTSMTTGKELFQNAADAVMRNPDGIPKVIYSGYDGDMFHIGDTGPGMTPDIILDKFLPAGESGKGVGSAGGLGLAKIAILGGNPGWTVVTAAKNPDGPGLIISTLKGSGPAYYDYIDNPPNVKLVPDKDIELSDGMTLRYEYVSDSVAMNTGTFASIETKNPWDADMFVSDAARHTPQIERRLVSSGYRVDPNSLAGQLGIGVGANRYGEQPHDMGIIHTIDAPFGTIEIIAPKGGRTKQSSYQQFGVLNRGILQFWDHRQFHDAVSLPGGITVNIKPSVAAEDKLYPFTTNRENLTDDAANLITNWLNASGKAQLERLHDIYRNAVKDAPRLDGQKDLVILDVGQNASPELLERIRKNPEVNLIAKETGDIQNAILEALARKYPEDNFGRAKYMGLLTGGKSYGVHFGGQDASESGIYHDVFLSWRDAKAEASAFLAEEAANLPHVEGMDRMEEKSAFVEQHLDRTVYERFRSKVAGISLHEALHQVTPSEGEDLARQLTFRAGEIIKPVANLPEQTKTLEQYAIINKNLSDLGNELALRESPSTAGDFIVSQGGYAGYALKETGGDAPGTRRPEARLPEAQGQVAPAPAATQQAQPEATPDYGPPPPDNTENRRKGAFRRQQRGSVSEDALSSLAGTGLGGAYGFISTEKREDESEEQFQARRLKNMLAWAAGGAAAGFGTSRALTPGKRAIRRDGGPQPSSRVARSLGMVVDHKPIMQRISDTALLAEKWKNIALRGSPMRKPFYDATQRAQYRIMAGLAETVSILNNMRRIVVTQHSGPQKQAVFDKINEVFLDISKLEQLPANLQKDAARMFGIRAHNATLLNNMEGLTQATRDTIAENGGNYLARQYAIFDLKNERELRAYKESLAPEDVSAALDAIQESWKPKPKSPEEQKFAADTIEFVAKQAVGGSDDAVASIKSLRPWMTDADAARVAAWVAGGKQPGLPKVRALYQELLNPSDVTRDEAKVLLDQFLDRNQFGPFSIGRKEIGGKDVTSLYQKQEIDTRLRKVLGEVKDPLKNAYRTVDNQVQLIERDRQQRELIGIGSGMNIMTKDADVAASKGFQPFVKAGTQLNGSYDNWDGVYIDPVFREEFQGLFNQSGMDDNLAKKLILDPIRTATGVFKWMKIIPSTDSRSINALGAYLNNVQNGRALNPLGKGYREGTKALLTQAGLINPTGGPNGKAINDLIKVMTEQGIMDESAIGRDFQENIKNGTLDGALGKIDAFIQNGISNPTARKAAMLARFEVSGGEFAAADTVARIAGFLSERADYRKAYPDLSDGAIDDLAGRAMRMTGMIYSEVPHILRKLSGYSVLPAFINFPYATARAAINGARLGAAEVKEGRETGNNAILRKGARRLASLALVTAAASGGGVSYWVNKSNGITDKQEDAARRMGPSYIQNSAIMFGGPIENGRASIVEQSYLLPNAMLTTPFGEGIEAAKDGGFWQGLERTSEVALEPFLGGSNENVMSLGPVAGTIEQIRGNKNEFGERIFNPEDPEKNKVISKYILNKFAPGGWSKAQRMSKALSDNPVGTSGQVYSMKEEALRTLGRRSTTIDARVILPRRSADIYSRYTNAGKLYTETVRKNPSFTPEEKAAAYKKMTDAQAEVFSDLVQLYDDGKTFGLGDSEIRRGMDMAGVPNALINQVRATKYRPNRQIQLDHKLEQRLRLQDRFRAGGAGNIVTDGPPPGPQLPPPKKSEFVPYK